MIITGIATFILLIIPSFFYYKSDVIVSLCTSDVIGDYVEYCHDSSEWKCKIFMQFVAIFNKNSVYLYDLSFSKLLNNIVYDGYIYFFHAMCYTNYNEKFCSFLRSGESRRCIDNSYRCDSLKELYKEQCINKLSKDHHVCKNLSNSMNRACTYPLSCEEYKVLDRDNNNFGLLFYWIIVYETIYICGVYEGLWDPI